MKDRVRGESAEDKRSRIDGTKRKEDVAACVGSQFRENKRTQARAASEFKHSRNSSLFHEPPDEFTPGLAVEFNRRKPKKVEDGMFYTFNKLLPPSYWRKVSGFSLAYAEHKSAGEDTNAALPEKDRHPSYKGAGKQRPWNPKWVSPDGLLLFHALRLLMVINKRAAHEEHFSNDPLLRSCVAEFCTLILFEQTARFFCPYDVHALITDPEWEGFDPHAKYRSIMEALKDGIHAILCPPRTLSYDEGGKPWSGKGGHGITVHYNPSKPNQRMSMCFMFAAFGIPFAWEFYTGKNSNIYNEKESNTPEEKGFGTTIARILRLLRAVKGTGYHLYFDNLFTSLFLFYLLDKLYGCRAVGTHRANNNLPTLSWEGDYTRGDTKWATSWYDNVPFTYLEY
ncbi:hypothetical protein CYMTET_28643, partial [Cymbomonas tetramitiformis]